MPEQPALNEFPRYQRLIDIMHDLASTLDLDVLLKRIVHAAADLCDSEEASILLFDPAKHELYFEAATNLESPQLETIIVPVESSLAGWIVTNRKPVMISDVSKDARHYTQVGQVTNLPTHSLLGVPMITKDKVIGALEAINKRSGEFTPSDQDILTTLGAQAAVAIENTRLFNQSDLISELVHELRTPLASLSTALHLLLRKDIPQSQRDHIGALVAGEITRLSDLTTVFLDLARLESGRAQFHISTFNPGKLLEEARLMMASRAAERSLTLTLEKPDQLPNLTADEDKIKQVLHNLTSNAIKYNLPGGSVLVRAEPTVTDLTISVKDTGPGIPAESLPNLFTKFYRVPGTENMAGGTGLGLSICKHIVEAHRGRISVESTLGVGTTFSFTIPLEIK